MHACYTSIELTLVCYTLGLDLVLYLFNSFNRLPWINMFK
jgi:hypothetical protein